MWADRGTAKMLPWQGCRAGRLITAPRFVPTLSNKVICKTKPTVCCKVSTTIDSRKAITGLVEKLEKSITSLEEF